MLNQLVFTDYGDLVWFNSVIYKTEIKMASYLLGTVQSSTLFVLLLCSSRQDVPLLQTTHNHRRPSQNIPVYYQFKFPSLSIKSPHFPSTTEVMSQSPHELDTSSVWQHKMVVQRPKNPMNLSKS